MSKWDKLVWGAALFGFAATAGAMQINIVAGPTLAANTAALASFQRAADAWDAVFSDPIFITIDADLSSAFANPNIIGSTSSVELQADYNTIRDALVADSAGQADKSIVALLPTAAQFSALVPTGFSLSPNIVASKANLKAMGFTDLDAIFGASDATVTFNSNFAFYFGTGPVPGGLVDFQSVATHELGHALGFFSAVDDIDYIMSNSTPGAVSLNPLDLYRFGSGSLPVTAAQFTNNPRSLVPNATAYFSDTVSQYGMSTGQFNGDGRQASHWKDDSITGTHIGVMDPTIASGVKMGITSADVRGLELIGYDLVPEPGTVILMAGALMGLIVIRKRQVQ